MPDRQRRRLLLVGSALLALIPVLFGLIRAINTGWDVRYLWLAGASLLGSWIAARPLGRGSAGRPHVLLRTAMAVILGALCAAVTAVVLGASAGPGVAIVAISFGLCTGTSAMFGLLARPLRTS
ncbi:MAG TPA: hypothetical protein VH458_03295 [Vicinamibacterales bacterium]|jgi:hypothetical protein